MFGYHRRGCIFSGGILYDRRDVDVLDGNVNRGFVKGWHLTPLRLVDRFLRGTGDGSKRADFFLKSLKLRLHIANSFQQRGKPFFVDVSHKNTIFA